MNPNKEMAQRYWSDPDYYVAEWKTSDEVNWRNSDRPNFHTYAKWRVSLATVEGKPVFDGDVGYSKENGSHIKISSYDSRKTIEQNFTWNPHKRTVMVNGTELPLPNEKYGNYHLQVYDTPYMFNTFADVTAWERKIAALMRGEE